jgi:hypothetical protein
VVIIKTPLAPADPYNAVAAAPFKTLTLSTIDGSMSFNRLLPAPSAPPVGEVDSELSTGTPSMTINA